MNELFNGMPDFLYRVLDVFNEEVETYVKMIAGLVERFFVVSCFYDI
ncbi:hypothetical protein K0U91_09140 [Chryseobacterium chendengshani]|nr:hypothetical protein [Chryseobacterium sp. LJ668]MBW8524517.1 hypothetical protein [Chryseobacterium sp. LJ668]QYK15241.1 hypothetical protein K0U91_09140 [Chryseobacterium sp. LJ668]